jgi:hypothetical protein
MWLAAKYPNRVKSLSLHSGWAKTDPFLKTVVEGWQVTAKALGSVPEMVILSIFPWCFTPELYAAKPEYIQSLADFVRGRPEQPLASFLQASNAVIAHDVAAQLGQITVPTQISFGRHDMATSTRFADQLTRAIRGSELLIFEECAHAPIYQKVEEFNQKTLAFQHPGENFALSDSVLKDLLSTSTLGTTILAEASAKLAAGVSDVATAGGVMGGLFQLLGRALTRRSRRGTQAPGASARGYGSATG